MNSPLKTALRGEALKQAILDTALRMFSERGYFNTSVHDIRHSAGVSTGAIYHHFKNKEALVQSLYDNLLQQIDDAIDDACRHQKGSLSKSRAIISKLFQLTLDQPQAMQFVLLAQHREYLPDKAPICSSSPFQTMKQVVIDGMVNGEIKQVEPWVAATALFGGALRMMNLQLDGVLERPLGQYLDEVMECAWSAVKAN